MAQSRHWSVGHDAATSSAMPDFFLILWAIFALSVGIFWIVNSRKTSRESEGDYSASTFIVPGILLAGMGVFALFQAFTG
jgi:hypothetical protein